MRSRTGTSTPWGTFQARQSDRCRAVIHKRGMPGIGQFRNGKFLPDRQVAVGGIELEGRGRSRFFALRGLRTTRPVAKRPRNLRNVQRVRRHHRTRPVGQPVAAARLRHRFPSCCRHKHDQRHTDSREREAGQSRRQQSVNETTHNENLLTWTNRRMSSVYVSYGEQFKTNFGIRRRIFQKDRPFAGQTRPSRDKLSRKINSSMASGFNRGRAVPISRSFIDRKASSVAFTVVNG